LLYFILVFIVATYYGTLYVFVSNCAQLLHYKFGYDEIEADYYFTIMTLTGAVISPFVGAYLDKQGQRGLLLSFGIFLILTGYLCIVHAPIYPVISIMIAGFGDSLTANCVLSILSVIVPEEKYATGYGFMASLYFVTQSILFYIVGLLNQNEHASQDMIKSSLELSITVLGFVLSLGFLVSIFFNLYDYKYNGGSFNVKPQKSFKDTFGFHKDYESKEGNGLTKNTQIVSTYM